MNKKIARRRAIASSIVFSAVAALFLIALNLPVISTRVLETQIGQRATMAESRLSGLRPIYRRAGFPLHYHVQFVTQTEPLAVVPLAGS